VSGYRELPIPLSPPQVFLPPTAFVASLDQQAKPGINERRKLVIRVMAVFLAPYVVGQEDGGTAG